MNLKIIALLTDFGVDSPYVGEMKAVIYSINPEAKIIDITHSVPAHNITVGAFLLYSVSKFLPKDSILVGVVDPGVGTSRNELIFRTKRGFYVGPDNGLLYPTANRDGILSVHKIINKLYMRPQISRTFHGRDIFAPVAAYLSLGVSPIEIGPETTRYIKTDLPKPRVHDDFVETHILYIDMFGNLTLDIDVNFLSKLGWQVGDNFLVRIGDDEYKIPLLESYGYSERNSLLFVVNSFDYLELAINQGNAALFLKLNIGDSIRIRKL
ncbi:MAG: S-adenosyl-l-methionine hydroxide adenosyltransferase family protein [Thermoprotei archaeon]